MAFYERFPSPVHLKGYTPEALTTEMKEICKQLTLKRSATILGIVRSNGLYIKSEPSDLLVRSIIADIRIRQEMVAEIEKQCEPLIKATGYKLTTMPGVGLITAMNIISEIGDINRFKSESSLAQFAGVAPVSIGSAGKTREDHPKNGNRNLRATLYFMTVGMVSYNRAKEAKYPIFRGYFEKKISEGKTKSQALVCIMRQLVRII